MHTSGRYALAAFIELIDADVERKDILRKSAIGSPNTYCENETPYNVA